MTTLSTPLKSGKPIKQRKLLYDTYDVTSPLIFSVKFKTGFKRDQSRIIEVEFKKDEFYPTIKQRQFTEIDFLSYIGGTLGLFAGFSVLTVFELFSFFALRCGFDMIAKVGRKKVQPITVLTVRKYRMPSKTSKLLKNVRKFVYSYVENSSVHGISHASLKNLTRFERCDPGIKKCLLMTS